MSEKIICGDALEVLKTLENESVQCCITSLPYFCLRDYGHEGQIGLEETPEQYVAALVAVFQEVNRVLKRDGTLWLNLGDSYSGSGKGQTRAVSQDPKRGKTNGMKLKNSSKGFGGIKQKDLIGIPWRVAFALQADGWYLRQDIIWSKPNAMPESVTDRPTTAHEHLFLLTKSAKYYYDHEAIKEPAVNGDPTSPRGSNGVIGQPNAGRRDKQGELGRRTYSGFNARWDARDEPLTHRNKRSVWTIPTQPYNGAHFAVMPEAMVEPCILAGCPEGGTVLDPFGGAATTGLVAKKFGRNYIGIELNPEYIKISERRLNSIPSPMF